MEITSEMAFWCDCDRAVIGVATRHGMEDSIAYDYDKLVEIFMEQGMDMETAKEYIQFNLKSAWIGDTTPIIVHKVDR
jgi:hypothetical protein